MSLGLELTKLTCSSRMLTIKSDDVVGRAKPLKP